MINYNINWFKFYNKREIKLFLTRFRYIIIFGYNMYYKSLRSRIMFKKTLWNREINQKKYFDMNLSEIKIQSKSIKKLSEINLENEVKKFGKEVSINFIKKNEKYFSFFYGHIVIFEYTIIRKKTNEKMKTLGIAFFNLMDINMKYLEYINYNYMFKFSTNDIHIFFYRLFTEEDYNTMIFILKFFFKDNKNINLKEWEMSFNSTFQRFIDLQSSDIELDKNVPVKFHNFNSLNDVIECLSSIKSE